MSTSPDGDRGGVPVASVVVGVDGSTCGDLALDWAARQASLEGRPLVLVHGVSPLPPGAATYLRTTGTPFSRWTAQLRADAEALLHEAATRVRSHYPRCEIHELIRLTDARQALLDAGSDAGSDAAMLVVGSRGLGTMRQLLLGSVGQAVAAHATSPVVVVRPHQGQDRDSGIVIGVSGDERDPPVVDFGFRLAATRGLPVTLVHCFWDRPGSLDGTDEMAAGQPDQDDRHAILSEAGRLPSQHHASVPVRLLLNRGFADVQLIKASHHAELVLVGHRHKPLLREFVYGSLAPRVVENAACPVAVVPLEHSLEHSIDQPRDDPDRAPPRPRGSAGSTTE